MPEGSSVSPAARSIKLAPSILSADFSRLGEQVARATRAGADYIHVDIMDGHFVPALTFGPLVVEAIHPWTDRPLDLHLMVERPEQLIAPLAQAGADLITVHVEACTHLHRVLHQIREKGLKAGVALNPATPLSAVEEALSYADQVLVMTVNPGLPGQPFLHEVLDKVRRLRRVLDQRELALDLEVDGGINASTAFLAVQAGARVLVAGSAVFAAPEGIETAMARIRKEAEQAIERVS